MDDAERSERRQQIADKIKERQGVKGNRGPLPAFLDVLTDYMIDTDEWIEDLREEIVHLRKDFVEHKHYVTPGGETHAEKLDRLEKLIIDRTANRPILGER